MRGVDLIAAALPLTVDRVRQWRNSSVRRKAQVPRPSIEIAPAAGTGPPTLVLFVHWFEPGGAETCAFACADLARRSGWYVVALADQPAAQRLQGRVAADETYVLAGWSDSQVASWLSSLGQSVSPRLVHLHHGAVGYRLLPSLRRAWPGCRFMDTTHIDEHVTGGFVSQSIAASPWLDHHHVISRDLLVRFVAAGVPPEKLLLAPLTDLHQGADRTPPAAPNVTRTPAGSPLRLAFVGRMVQQKRPALFLSLVQRMGDAVRAEMLGEGPLLDTTLRRWASRLGVTLHPAEANVPALLGRSDALLLSSDNEGLTLVAMEATACGALVLSTDVGGQRELVADSLLLPRDPFAWRRGAVERLRRLRAEPEFRLACWQEQLAKAAALARLTPSLAALALLYREGLAEPPA